MKETVKYLDHYLSGQGVSIDPRKIEAINKWTPPETVSHVRSFLGLASYYRKFVKNFSAIAAPLTDLLHKDCKFIWASAQQEAFDELKRQLTTAPVLLIPDPALPFTITSDASDFAIRAILSQDQGKGQQLVAYESRKLTSAEQNYPIHEKELLTIVHAIKLWRPYLEGQCFIVITDHASLEYIKTQYNISVDKLASLKLYKQMILKYDINLAKQIL